MLVIAAVSAVSVVPRVAAHSLTDPSYWGLAGYLLVTVLLIRRPSSGWGEGGARRRLVLAFLVGLPLVYVADRIRFGGSPVELIVELVGLGLWVGVAVLARRNATFLWLGCVGHTLWDALHFGRVGFVPEWYVAACLVADMAVGSVVLVSLEEEGVASP